MSDEVKAPEVEAEIPATPAVEEAPTTEAPAPEAVPEA